MIPVARVPEPGGWPRVEERGNAWLAAHPDRDPHDKPIWREHVEALARGFGYRCGWLAMHAFHGQVDHLVPIATSRNRAYEWANLRYADPWINSKKRQFEVLDPYEVGDDWFELVWPSLELRMTSAVPIDRREVAARTLRLLGLDHEEEVIRYRQSWLDSYRNGAPIEVVRDWAPLVARAIERNKET